MSAKLVGALIVRTVPIGRFWLTLNLREASAVLPKDALSGMMSKVHSLETPAVADFAVTLTTSLMVHLLISLPPAASNVLTEATKVV